MAKRKNARPNLPEEALARARAELYGDEAVVTTPAKTGGATAALRTDRPAPKRAVRYVSMEELREEYAYVLADLRSMALLAAVLIVGMIVVSVILV